MDSNDHSDRDARVDQVPGPRCAQPVLDILAPLTTAYVRRAEPGAVPATPPPTPTDPQPADQAFTPCRVHGVVTIDSERRVVWPDALARVRQTCVALRALRGAIEVVLDAEGGAYARPMDQRGRLRLPSGLLSASGLRAGDRVVIACAGTADRLLLVPADRVGISLAVA